MMRGSAARWADNFDVVVANVPLVVPEDFEAQSDAPAIAYRGHDSDRLGLHRQLATQASRLLRPAGALILQLAPGQWGTLQPELQGLGFTT
jgi:methylase of polypeptide subunit release factors